MTEIVPPAGQQVVPREHPVRQLVSRVRSDEFRQQVALALPGGEGADRFTRALVTALMQNPTLAVDAEHETIFLAAIRAAQDGLLPDGKEAAIVVYGRKAQYLPMIAGLRLVAAEQGWTIQTRVVYANDEFDYDLGLNPDIKHKPVRPGVERGDPIAAYAIGESRTGQKQVEVMTFAEIEKVRNVSRAKSAGPWRDWWDRMAEKTVGRRLFAKLPLGDRERVNRVLEASAPEVAGDLWGHSEAQLAPAPEYDFVEGEIVADKADSPPEPDGGTEPTPPPTDPPSEPSLWVEVTDADLAAIPFGDPEPLPVIEQPALPLSQMAAPKPDTLILRKARATRPPLGTYQDKTLAKILELPEADDSLRWLLLKYPESDEMFGRLLWALLRVERPGLVAEVTG